MPNKFTKRRSYRTARSSVVPFAILMAAAVMLAAQRLNAANYSWAVSAGDWSVATNRYGRIIPSGTQSAFINHGGEATVRNSVPASNQVIIGSANAGTVQEVGGYFQSVDRAGLDLNSVLVLSDSEGVFSTDASPFTDLAPGPLSNRFDLFIDTSRLGKFSGTYQFNLSDEQDLSGWAGGQMLTLNVTADVVPEPSTLVLLVAAAVGLLTFAWHARGAIPRT